LTIVLTDPLEEVMFVSQVQPLGFEIACKESMMYSLHKALYGLKQAPHGTKELIGYDIYYPFNVVQII